MFALSNREKLPIEIGTAFDELLSQLSAILSTDAAGVLDARPTAVDYVPVGAITLWPRDSIPANWLRCNGATINRSVYAALFRVLGTTFGAGNGTTTFTLPTIADLGTAHYIVATGKPVR